MDYARSGFKTDPFGAEFDSDFLYQGKSWTAVYHNLAFEIQANREVILLIGEKGVGKSWLLKALEFGLASQAKFVFQRAGSIDYHDFIEKLCSQLDLHIPGKEFPQKLERLNEFLSMRQPPHIVLVIEDAHLLSQEVLAKVATVPMPVIQQAVSFQIVLSGQPDLKTKYRRIETDNPCTPRSASVTLEGYEQVECSSYIIRRLRIAGKPDSELFPQETLIEIWRVSHGIPGRINEVCAIAIQNAIRSGQDTVSPAMIPLISNDRAEPKNRVLPAPLALEPETRNELIRSDRKREEKNRFWFPTRLLNRPGMRFSLLCLTLFLLLNLQSHSIGSKQSPNTFQLPQATDSMTRRSTPNERPDFLLTEYYSPEWITPVSEIREPDLPNYSDAHHDIDQQSAFLDQPGRANQTAVQAFPAPDMDVRAYIRKQESEGRVDPEEIFQTARSLSERSLDADAYLLYFRAARLGHRDSAYMLGRMNDPTVSRNRPNSLGNPDTVQAYKWYKKAAKAGHTEAQIALIRLRSEIAGLASSGNVMAQRWLLQWE